MSFYFVDVFGGLFVSTSSDCDECVVLHSAKMTHRYDSYKIIMIPEERLAEVADGGKRVPVP